MSRKIIDYKIANYQVNAIFSLEDLDSWVCWWLQQGWQLHGPLLANSSFTHFCQALVKYEEDTKKNINDEGSNKTPETVETESNTWLSEATRRKAPARENSKVEEVRVEEYKVEEKKIKVPKGKKKSSALNDVLDVNEAAEYIGRTRVTLCNWRNKNKGPKFMRVSKSAVYHKVDLDKWLEKRRKDGRGRYE